MIHVFSIKIAAYHPAFVIDAVEEGVECTGIIDWKGQRAVRITNVAMVSTFIRIRADNLIEIVHAAYGSKGSRKRK